MKQNLSILIVLSLLFAFSACQPEEEVVNEYVHVEYTGAEYLAKYFTPNAMFLVAYQDASTKKRSGFLIDNLGNLRKLASVTNNPESAHIQPELLQSMIRSSEIVEQVDLDMLVEQFKKVRLAIQAKIIDKEGDPTAQQTIEYYGFTLGVPGYTGGGGCGGTGTITTTYSQFMLKSEGLRASIMDSDKAVEIVEWLEGFTESVK